jgi:hypothetical protein
MRGERPFWFRAALRIFHWCVRLTPKAFRERFGGESEEAFQHLVEDTLAREGSSAAMTTAAAACSDIARTGMVERVAGWRGALGSGLTGDVAQAARIYRREPPLAARLRSFSPSWPAGSLPSSPSFTGWCRAPALSRCRPACRHRAYDLERNQFYLRAASVADYRNVTAFLERRRDFPISFT